ncbi:MAG: hypothetical protein RR205_00560, partial [Oscillospiraceae bacterium]
KIPALLSGILSMLALYSINIRIMGAPNTPLNGETTIVTMLCDILPFSKSTVTMILGVLVVAILIAALYWFFGTEVGCAIRATGNNEYMVRALGEDTDKMKIFGLLLGNGLVSLSGALVAQSQGYADVQMGQGAIVIGLASIIIGEVIFGNRFSFAYRLMSVVVGAIFYRLIIAIVLQLGLKSTDLKLLTAAIVALALALPVIRKKPMLMRFIKILACACVVLLIGSLLKLPIVIQPIVAVVAVIVFLLPIFKQKLSSRGKGKLGGVSK